jgi:hypothetical protein
MSDWLVSPLLVGISALRWYLCYHFVRMVFMIVNGRNLYVLDECSSYQFYICGLNYRVFHVFVSESTH